MEGWVPEHKSLEDESLGSWLSLRVQSWAAGSRTLSSVARVMLARFRNKKEATSLFLPPNLPLVPPLAERN